MDELSWAEREVDFVRTLLKEYEDGNISRAEFGGVLHNHVIDPLLDSLEKGNTIFKFGSCCCRSHPPTRSFIVKLKIEPHGYVGYRLFSLKNALQRLHSTFERQRMWWEYRVSKIRRRKGL